MCICPLQPPILPSHLYSSPCAGCQGVSGSVRFTVGCSARASGQLGLGGGGGGAADGRELPVASGVLRRSEGAGGWQRRVWCNPWPCIVCAVNWMLSHNIADLIWVKYPKVGCGSGSISMTHLPGICTESQTCHGTTDGTICCMGHNIWHGLTSSQRVHNGHTGRHSPA